VFLWLATGLGNETMFALLVELCQDCTQPPGILSFQRLASMMSVQG
jgi:hypothetical protein